MVTCTTLTNISLLSLLFLISSNSLRGNASSRLASKRKKKLYTILINLVACLMLVRCFQVFRNGNIIFWFLWYSFINNILDIIFYFFIINLKRTWKKMKFSLVKISDYISHCNIIVDVILIISHPFEFFIQLWLISEKLHTWNRKNKLILRLWSIW